MKVRFVFSFQRGRRNFCQSRLLLACLSLVMGGAAPAAGATAGREIEESFRRPPDAAKVWVYWWWLNGCVTRDGIVRDLDHMKNQGISGALIFHAGEGETPWRTEFMSPDWRELFKFTVTEAARRGGARGRASARAFRDATFQPYWRQCPWNRRGLQAGPHPRPPLPTTRAPSTPPGSRTPSPR